MTVGEKIKQARVRLKLTQEELAGDKITRNMLSYIESGKASPSIQTLEYLARRLDLPLSFLLSGENDLFFYLKKERMPLIKAALESKNYTVAISHAIKIGGYDDEVAYILAMCYFELGISCVKGGALQSALSHLTHSLEFCKKTIYDTLRFQAIAPIYLAIAQNINSPLLEFDVDKFAGVIQNTFEYEFYRYFILDLDYEYTEYQLKTHVQAKKLIKERKYSDALALLIALDEEKNNYERNAYILFGVYSDIEICYKQLFDFENAYRYASKRISLMEGFKI